MIIDTRQMEKPAIVSTDVCIVGAGVAGIALARELEGAPFRVGIFESGGIDADWETQQLYRGESVGHPYYPLETARSRQFAGSSNRWLLDIGGDRIGARLRPLDGIDFEPREWVPYSGWPFRKAHLEPFYRRAQERCSSGPYAYSLTDWLPRGARALPLNGDVGTAVFQFVSREVFRDYRKEVASSENVSVYLHANILEICTKDFGATVKHLRAATLEGGELVVKARLYVLALGGIETPRLLLLSRDHHAHGVGNQHDLVGRFFMEHPHLWSGYLIPAQRQLVNSATFYRIGELEGVAVLGQLSVSEAAQRRERLLNYSSHLLPWAPPRKGVKAALAASDTTLRHLLAALRNRDLSDFNRHLSTLAPVTSEFSIALYRKAAKVFERIAKRPQRFEMFRLNHMVEQRPNPNSRVTLGREKDRFGQNLVQLDWQLTAQDIRSMRRCQELIDAELRRAALGRLDIELRSDTVPEALHGGWHHMGTTRMHRDAKQGVVDENCRVHGVDNLYIAGPSLFPTSGYANPVLTIMALSIRLADHLCLLMATRGTPCGETTRPATVGGINRSMP